MTTVADVAGWLEQFAPLDLAESWDNVGLLWGDPAVDGPSRDDLPDGHTRDGGRGHPRAGFD